MGTPGAAGLLTFLFTDIEGSTARWEADPAAMRDALRAHDDALVAAVAAHGGDVFKHTGDGMCAVFESPAGAIEAAVAAQDTVALPVRMGIATGEADARGGDYFGPALNRAARVMDAGHGGQILVAASTAALVDHDRLLDLGEQHLRGVSTPERVHQVLAAGLRRDFPALRTDHSLSGNLPVEPSDLIGRDAEVDELAGLVGDARVITLTGVGGVGKTRLAQRVAGLPALAFPDGRWWVDLAPVDAAAVPGTVAAVFNVTAPDDADLPDAIARALGRRRALLVLDNCEHVLTVAADLVERLVATCPDVVVLATSREALGVAGERVWPVPSLDTGGAGSASAELFARRAREVGARALDEADEDVVDEICTRLDGIPLALELAAARLTSMTPAQLRDRLDARFRLLTGGRRGLERHQTLHNTVKWSFDLLDPDEQRVLARASVFAGGFDLAAATAVCADGGEDDLTVLDHLDALTRRSLVVADRREDHVRYRLLETIRQFAEEVLSGADEAVAIRDRHAGHFADTADRAWAWFLSPDERRAYEWVDDELPNLQAAFEWSVARGETDLAVRLAAHTHEIARFRLRTETHGWAARVLDVAREARHPLLPLLLTMACDSAWARGDFAAGRRLGEEALACNDEPGFEPFGWAYSDFAMMDLLEGDLPRAIEHLERGADSPYDVAHLCLSVLASFVAPDADDHAVALATRAVAATEAFGMPSQIAGARLSLAGATKHRDLDASIESARDALRLSERSGNRFSHALFLQGLLDSDWWLQDHVEALEFAAAVLSGLSLSGDAGLGRGLGRTVTLLADTGHPRAAAVLAAAIGNDPALGIDAGAFVDLDRRLADELGPEAWEACRREGRSLSITETVAYAEEAVAAALAEAGTT